MRGISIQVRSWLNCSSLPVGHIMSAVINYRVYCKLEFDSDHRAVVGTEVTEPSS